MSTWGEDIYFYGLGDDQVDDYVSSPGFKECAGGHAKSMLRKKLRFLYINCGEFGLLRGQGTKCIKPEGDVPRLLQEEARVADVIFIMLSFDNCNPKRVHAKRKVKGEVIFTRLPYWDAHAGMIIIDQRDTSMPWKYYDGQLYGDVSKSRHWAWIRVQKNLPVHLQAVLGLTMTKFEVQRFSQHVP